MRIPALIWVSTWLANSVVSAGVPTTAASDVGSQHYPMRAVRIVSRSAPAGDPTCSPTP